ncbi:MAG: hypothetical protein ACRD18_06460 [Terriglobia bacterium]
MKIRPEGVAAAIFYGAGNALTHHFVVPPLPKGEGWVSNGTMTPALSPGEKAHGQKCAGRGYLYKKPQSFKSKTPR